MFRANDSLSPASVRGSLPKRDASFAGSALPVVMGIVNVTPDSFFDGGRAFRPAVAIKRGLALAGDGADILDIGGESTRPGAAPVSVDEELRRVLPVVEALADKGCLVSIDTRKAAVMKAACQAGAAIVNDVTALTGDPRSIDVVAAAGASVILMHMSGEPGSMQNDPRYADAPQEIFDYLAGRVEACVAAGIPRHRIAVDPGIGFGKTPRHNAEILGRLDLYRDLGCPLALGVSRKSFIGALSGDAPSERRLGGSLAALLAGVAGGADILRVHDVFETRQALDIWRAIGLKRAETKS